MAAVRSAGEAGRSFYPTQLRLVFTMMRVLERCTDRGYCSRPHRIPLQRCRDLRSAFPQAGLRLLGHIALPRCQQDRRYFQQCARGTTPSSPFPFSMTGCCCRITANDTQSLPRSNPSATTPTLSSPSSPPPEPAASPPSLPPPPSSSPPSPTSTNSPPSPLSSMSPSTPSAAQITPKSQPSANAGSRSCSRRPCGRRRIWPSVRTRLLSRVARA